MDAGKTEVLHATSRHLPAIEDLWRAIAREANSGDAATPGREIEGLYRSLREHNFLASDSFWFLLALVDGQAIGYLTAVRIPKADGRIGVLYVDELHVLRHHRRCGVGSALLQEVCSIGRELGFWRVRLNADQNDAGVCAFYEANGFRHRGDGFFQRDVPKERGIDTV